MRKFLLIFALLLTFPIAAHAQLWSGILDPSRATDWTQVGVPGGIPNWTTVCATLTPSGDSSGATDWAHLKAAFVSCTGLSEVISLGAGTFYFDNWIFNTNGSPGNSGAVSDVVVRGNGPLSTIIYITANNPCVSGHDAVCLGPSTASTSGYAGSTTWTGNYAKGDTTITVGSTTGLNKGMWIVLDQLSDSVETCPASGGTGLCSGVAGATDSSGTATITTTFNHGYSTGQCVQIGSINTTGYDGWWTIASVPTANTFTYSSGCSGTAYAGASVPSGLANDGGGTTLVDNGGITIPSNNDIGIGSSPPSDEYSAIEENATEGRMCPDSGNSQCRTGEISQRPIMEFHQITNISGTTLTITPPIIMPNWRAGQLPGVFWGEQLADQSQYIGLENATFDYSMAGLNDANAGIGVSNCYGCWVRNIRSLHGGRNHVWINNLSANIEVVSNYFFGTAAGGTKSYGVESNDTGNNLVVNNIFQHIPATTIRGADVGSVAAYNYSIDSGYNTNSGTVADWLIGMMFENHDYGEYSLDEGNDVDATNVDNNHGVGDVDTVFRNRLRGQDTPPRTTPMLVVMINAFNRAENFIANVMGTGTLDTGYQTTGCTEPCIMSSIPTDYVYWLDAQSETGHHVPNDPVVTSSLMRWGNYDTVSSPSVRWVSAEVPTTGVTYISGNSVPSSHTLPASFFLSGQPNWWQTKWATPPWPAIGPDITSGNAPDGSGGYAYSIPAQLAYNNLGVDSSYQITPLTVTGSLWSSSNGSYTVSSTSALALGDTISVSSSSVSGYNGNWMVTGLTGTTIQVFMPTNPGSSCSSSCGTVNYPNILAFDAKVAYPAEFGLGALPAPSRKSIAALDRRDPLSSAIHIDDSVIHKEKRK
jgi:hypothetical protein